MERPASVCPRGTAFTPARKTSARTPEAASAMGMMSIQNELIFTPRVGTTKKNP